VAHGFRGHEYDPRARDRAECSGWIPVHDETQNTIVNNLSEILAEAEHVQSNVKAVFGRLSGQQINWQPSAGGWSIAQCLEHLMLLNASYFPIIEDILSGRRKASLFERAPLLPAFFGWLVLSAVQPGAKQKVDPHAGLSHDGPVPLILGSGDRVITESKRKGTA
jgi:hypothetical protein